MVLSCEPEMARHPSAVSAHEFKESLCPSSVCMHCPFSRSHTLSVLSGESEMTRRPSGVIAHAAMPALCPWSVIAALDVLDKSVFTKAVFGPENASVTVDFLLFAMTFPLFLYSFISTYTPIPAYIIPLPPSPRNLAKLPAAPLSTILSPSRRGPSGLRDERTLMRRR